MSNFMKIRPAGAELFHADRRTHMTKLIVAFRHFEKAPKKKYYFGTGADTVLRVTLLHSYRTQLQYFLGFWLPKPTLPSYHTGFRSGAKCFTFIFNGDQFLKNKLIIVGNAGDIIFRNFGMESSDGIRVLSFKKTGASLFVMSASNYFFCLGTIKYNWEAIFEPPRHQTHLLNIT
jgi:hypothetical protein